MKVFFIRHAQSEANVIDVLGGQIDYNLTSQGLMDAKSIGLEFREKFYVNRIISSPLIRAQRTASEFADIFGIKNLEIDKRIIEQNVGVFSGKSYIELNSMPTYIHDRSKRWNWEPEGNGESYQIMSKRISSFLEDLQSNSDKDDHILVVTHAVALRLIYGYLKDMYPKYSEETPYNGEVWEVDNLEPNKEKDIKRYFFKGSRDSRA